MSTLRAFRALCKVAAEFPNMPTPPGGWGPPGVREEDKKPAPPPKKQTPSTPPKNTVNGLTEPQMDKNLRPMFERGGMLGPTNGKGRPISRPRTK